MPKDLTNWTSISLHKSVRDRLNKACIKMSDIVGKRVSQTELIDILLYQFVNDEPDVLTTHSLLNARKEGK